MAMSCVKFWLNYRNTPNLDLCPFIINHDATLIFICYQKYRDLVLVVMALQFYSVLLFVKDNTKECVIKYLI